MSKTPISILQELMVQKKEPMPDYKFAHSDKLQYPFQCTVKVGNTYSHGYATTKKEAKQNCAQAALEKLGINACIKNINNNVTISHVSQTFLIQNSSHGTLMNYVGQLNEMASTNGKKYPDYSDNIIPMNGFFTSSCSFLKWRTDGYGSSKKVAKQDAARKMLDIVKQEKECFETLVVVKKEKQENINKLSDEIVKRLEQMARQEGTMTTTITSTSSSALPAVMLNVSTLEDLRAELAKKGHHSDLQIYQRDPYIISLKIKDTNCVIMGHGETKEEALNDLFVSTRTMCSYSFSFSNSFP